MYNTGISSNRGSIVMSLASLTKDDDCKLNFFDNLQDFIDYVLIECSNCVKKESCIKEIENSKLYDCYKDNPKDRPKNCEEVVKVNCKEIKTSPLTARFLKKLDTDSDKKRYLVLHMLCLFRSKGLLMKRGGIYYLLKTNIRLTWNNIKLLHEKHITGLEDEIVEEIRNIFNDEKFKYDDVTLIKCLFWYLRKATVDSILSDIINYYKNKPSQSNMNIIAMSVGSTKLSSDYDISLDTSYEIGALIIKRFTTIIENIFKDDSESIFDTNVYGVSFTKRKGDNNFTESHKCDSNDIFYVKVDNNIEISQMIWCYIKLLLKLNYVLKQDDKVYEKLYSYLDNDMGMQNNKLFIQAIIFVNKYKSNIENYGKIVSKYNEYIMNNNAVTNDDSYLISNFISFVNYNGSETYLTNGAFIDVVINQQLCSIGDKIKISRPYMYFTSFIENISDLLTHYHKSKYTERCENSLNELNKLLRDQGLSEWSSVYSDTLDLLKWLRITQKKCDEDVYKCQVFDLMYTCIYIVVKVSNVYYKYVTKTYSSLDEGIWVFDKIKFPEIDEDVGELSPIKT
jgi:hypothetical protein